jgi:zinc/manganese transport system ATP-binding protein
LDNHAPIEVTRVRLVAALPVAPCCPAFARPLGHLSEPSIAVQPARFRAHDARTTDELLQLIKRCHQGSRTIIAVLPDLDQVRDHFPSALLLARSCIAWGETSAVLTKDNLGRARKSLERSNKG